MNSYERMSERLQGREVDRPPNFDIMMVFAAHYIGQKLSKYYLDYRILCEANMAVLDAFDLDIVQAISDPYREAADFGVDIEFPDDGMPVRRAPLLAVPEDLNKLPSAAIGFGRRMNDRLEAIRVFRKQVGGEVPIMGWVEGALAEANVLRGDVTLMLDFYHRPDWVHELLEVCVQTEIVFAKAQVDAGADIVGLGDAIASQISPEMYQQFALPYERRILDAVKEAGGKARLHICGDTTHLLHLMPESGADIIDIDWMVDMQEAAEAFGAIPVCGNFDPVDVMLNGTPAEVKQATRQCIWDGGSRSISAAGCEIPDNTPEENLLAQAEALRSCGNYSV